MALMQRFKLKSTYAYMLLLSIQWFCFVWHTALPNKINAVAFMGSSFLFGLLIICNYYNKELVQGAPYAKRSGGTKLVITTIAVLAIISSYVMLNGSMAQHPIRVEQSDIIPSIMEVCSRLGKGGNVYAPIESYGYRLPITNLPMKWLPFLPARYLEIDYRWIPISIWAVSFLVLIRRSFKFNTISAHLFTAAYATIPILLMSIASHELSSVMADTVEVMVAGYYILLLLSFSSDHPILRGLIIGVCLMSRYSLVLWLPVAVVILWINEPRRNFFITSGTVLIFILAVYVLPFLSKDWGSFYRGYIYYDLATVGEWQHINEATGKPYHLFSGFGLASFIYDYIPNWDDMLKVKLIQRIHFFGSLLTTFLLIVVYFRIRTKINYKIYLLASFKIYLAIFMFLLQIPYSYLMVVDLMVSIALFSELGKYQIVGNFGNKDALPKAEVV